VTNPFLWLEIRIRASEKRLWVIALFFLISVLLIGGGILATAVVDKHGSLIPGELGMAMSYALLFWHGATIIVLAPLASAGRISQEREQRTLPALVNTSVNPSKIAWGKLYAAWIFILWLSSLVLPFLGIAALWGGLPIWKMLSFLLVNIIVSMVIAAIALGFSGVMRRSLTAYLVTGSFMLAWMLVLPILGSIGVQLCRSLDADSVRDLLMYVCFYSNPFYPGILIVSEGMELEIREIVQQVGYCFSVWLILAWLGVRMAIRGLKKEVY
jgi:ABC-type transport system involved in multi-copper enzyme maturation permease subunit